MAAGFVALLDVLGYSHMIARDSTGRRINRFLACLEKETVTGEVSSVIFSDRIMLTIEDEEPNSLLAIALACSRLMHGLLKEDIPFRGAISGGDIVRSFFDGSPFIAGRAVLDAQLFEQAQDWAGVMVAPSALERVPDLRKRCDLQPYVADRRDSSKLSTPNIEWAAFIQPCRKIPFHGQNPLGEPDYYEGFAVVPTSGDAEPAALRESIQVAIARLNRLCSIAPTPASRGKYERVIAWLKGVLQVWDTIASWHEQGE
jgi:hypothetical protein